jgi:hypothetical protein
MDLHAEACIKENWVLKHRQLYTDRAVFGMKGSKNHIRCWAWESGIMLAEVRG